MTTEYVAGEDRIRLAGDLGRELPVVVWLTQRLLRRLLPPMLGWLERQGGDLPHADLLQGFAQQAARSGMARQEPVRAADAGAAWLAQAVDLTDLGQGGGRLTFRGAHGQEVALVLGPQSLRQWLNILYDLFRRARWPMDLWPGWLRESAPTAAPPVGPVQ